jgi:hypothetical protein
VEMGKLATSCQAAAMIPLSLIGFHASSLTRTTKALTHQPSLLPAEPSTPVTPGPSPAPAPSADHREWSQRVIAELSSGYQWGSARWGAAHPVIKWWALALGLTLAVALIMPATIRKDENVWVGWTLPVWGVILALGLIVNRKWFNTFHVDALLTGALAAQAGLLVLWALIMWRVSLKG